MLTVFWDASALAKRYFGEIGSDALNALFAAVAAGDMLTTPWSYAETYSMLLRKHNGGVLDSSTFTTAVATLQTEVGANPHFGFLSISDAAVFASIPVMHQHNLNATDAALLSALLEHVQRQPLMPSAYAVVAADRRLLRACNAEGFSTINPEDLPAADVPTFLCSPASMGTRPLSRSRSAAARPSHPDLPPRQPRM